MTTTDPTTTGDIPIPADAVNQDPRWETGTNGYARSLGAERCRLEARDLRAGDRVYVRPNGRPDRVWQRIVEVYGSGTTVIVRTPSSTHLMSSRMLVACFPALEV